MGLVHILGNDNGVIYVVNSEGELLFYKDLARDGTNLNQPGTDKFVDGMKIVEGWAFWEQKKLSITH